MRHTKKAGTALLTSIIAVFIVSIIGFSLLAMSESGARLSYHRRDEQQAFDIADAGFQQAMKSLEEDSSYAGQSNTQFGPGSFTVKVSNGTSSQYKLITSTGVVSGAEGTTASQVVRGMVDLGSPPQIANYALVAKGPISMSGGSLIDSTPNLDVGNIASNTSIDMSGGTTVRGTASAAGPIKTSGSATADAGLFANAKPVVFPTVDLTSVKAAASAYGVTNGNLTASSGQTVIAKGLINGNINISGTGALVIQGPVWVTGKVNLSGSSYSGAGSLYAEGDVNISGNSGLSIADTTQMAIVALASDNGALNVSGSSRVGGAVYVPNGLLSLSGSATVFGSLAANNVNLSGSMHITRNTNQQWPSEFSKPKLAYWTQ